MLGVGDIVLWSMALGGNIVSPDGHFSFELCMYIYVLTYKHYM